MANFYVNTTEVAHVIPNNGRPKFYMFGIPSYTNMGDQAVSLAERKYIESEFSEYQYIEVLEEDDDEAIPVVKKHLQSQDIIALLAVVIRGIYILPMKKPIGNFFQLSLTI